MRFRFWLIPCLLSLVDPWLMSLPSAQAQLLLDGTAGTTLSCAASLCQVAGGTPVGGNLFQSFARFEVGSGQTVEFIDPGVANILTRVTGAFASNIQGVLKVQGNANLFLINPNGINLGPGASLQLNGSFTATTADAIQLANGDRFSTNLLDPLPTQVLAVNPSAFLFNRPAIAPITTQGVNFSLAGGRNFLLVGGDLTLDSTQVVVFGGQLELAGLARPGQINLTQTGNQWSLSLPAGSDRADISLTNGTFLEVATLSQGGTIRLSARNILLSGASTLSAGINASTLNAFTNRSGDIVLNATGGVQLLQFSTIRNSLGFFATGHAGDIVVDANQLAIAGASQISALTNGNGPGGNVQIRVLDALTMDGSAPPDRPSLIQSSTTFASVGNGGSTTLTARTISLTNGAQIVSSMGGQGNAGGITIQAQDSILLSGGGNNGPSGLFSTISGNAVGRSGAIAVTAPSITMNQGAQIASSTGGRGDAGNVTIQASQQFWMDGTGLDGASTSIFSGVNLRGIGQGGNITIVSPNIALTNGAQLISATLGQGNAGNTLLQASQAVLLKGAAQDGPSAIFSGVIGKASGNSGQIQIQTARLLLSNGGALAAGTEGQGDAGNIQVDATQTTIVGSDPRFGYISGFFTLSQSQGQGGTINLNTSSLDLLNGAVLNATTSGTGAGGRINVTAQVFQASGGGQILTTTSGSGNAGSIQLTVSDLIRLQGANTGLFANTTAIASGSGGNITIDPAQLIVKDGASISVNSAGQGQAGNIAITANRLTLSRGSITAATASGEGGNITLQIPELLLLRYGSLISATANGTGNGGNLSINTGFVVAVPDENSDLIANAFRGRGGTITIATQGLFGLTFNPQLTARSDITASSEYGLSGVVTILTPAVNPAHGVTALPAEVVDASGLIAAGCTPTVRGSRFVTTGRGGLPPNPGEVLNQDASLEDVRLVAAPTLPSSGSTSNAQPAHSWAINAQGEVQLLAANPPGQCPWVR